MYGTCGGYVMDMNEYTFLLCGECSIKFSVLTSTYETHVRHERSIYCPNGHTSLWRDPYREAAKKKNIEKLLDGVQKWLDSFDDGKPIKDGMTIDEMKTLMNELRPPKGK